RTAGPRRAFIGLGSRTFRRSRQYIESKKLGDVSPHIELVYGHRAAAVTQSRPQVGIGEEPQDSSGDLRRVAAGYEKTCDPIVDELGNAANPGSDHRLARRHRLGNSETKHFFPAGYLTDHVRGGKYPITEWIFDEAGPREVILEPHLRRQPDIVVASRAVSHHDELHMNVLFHDDARRLEEVGDAFFRDDPTDLCDDRPTFRNPVFAPKFPRRVRVLTRARRVDAVINHVQSSGRKHVERRHARM